MNKFLLLLKNDIYQLRHKYILIIAIIAVVYSITALSYFYFSERKMVTTSSYTYELISIIMILSPFYLYGFLHQGKKNFFYAMRPASQMKKYSSILVQCFVVVPIVVFISSRLFELALSSFGWVNYTYESIATYGITYVHKVNNSISSYGSFISQALGVFIGASISILAVNLFKYKKIMKMIVFFYLLPLFLLYLIIGILYFMVGASILNQFYEFVSRILIMSIFKEVNVNINIVGFIIVIAMNYITWRIFKNKQLQ